MDYRIEIKELEDFNRLIDNIIDEIEEGKVKENPLKPKLEKEVEEIMEFEETAVDIYVEVTEEDVTADDEDFLNMITSTSLSLPEDGAPTETLIIDEDNQIIAHYKNAVEMSKVHDIHPTTARNRCSGNFVDTNNNTWYYRGKYEEANK